MVVCCRKNTIIMKVQTTNPIQTTVRQDPSSHEKRRVAFRSWEKQGEPEEDEDVGDELLRQRRFQYAS